MVSLSVDPGSSGAGYALWRGTDLLRAAVVLSNAETWEEATHDICEEIYSQAEKAEVKRVWCELPAFYQSAGGQVTAKSGALVKLSIFCGFLQGMFVTEQVPFEFVPVINWKGQLPKGIVEARIRRILPKKCHGFLKSHAIDAIGIGLYKLGRMR